MAEEKEQRENEEETPEIRVRDRRRVTPQGDIRDPGEVPPESPSAPAGTEPGEAEPSASSAPKPEPRLPTLNDFLRLMLMEFRDEAWPFLVRSAESGTLVPEDQAQARFGKELYQFFLDRLQASPDLSEGEKQELERLQKDEKGSYYDLARLVLMELHARGWQSLGLMPHPLTNLITTDLAQARQAIDTYSEVLNRLEATGTLSPNELREFRRLKNDLQMNYVQRVGLR